jgi:hypothetical protein
MVTEEPEITLMCDRRLLQRWNLVFVGQPHRTWAKRLRQFGLGGGPSPLVA